MTSFRVSIQPALLTWARESIGYSLPDAAKRLGVSEEQLSAWEGGKSSPTINQLRKAANVYKRPLAVFYLQEPPKDFDAMKDFRRLPLNRPTALSPQLIAELRRVHEQREIAIELAELAEDIPQPIALRLSLNVPAEEAGLRIREWLTIALEDQISWQDRYTALNRWIAAIEAKGVLVSQISQVAVDEIRGGAISQEPFPMILLNGKDSPRGRLFTLLHELTHILLEDGGICDLHELDRPILSQKDKVELYCNLVAASTLMPAEAVRNVIVEISGRVEQGWNDQLLAVLSTTFGASREAVLRRLVTLEVASMNDYLAARSRFLTGYQEHADEQSNAGGQADPYRVQIRNLGRRFISEVLNAYDNDRISSREVSELLGVKLGNIPKLLTRL